MLLSFLFFSFPLSFLAKSNFRFSVQRLPTEMNDNNNNNRRRREEAKETDRGDRGRIIPARSRWKKKKEKKNEKGNEIDAETKNTRRRAQEDNVRCLVNVAFPKQFWRIASLVSRVASLRPCRDCPRVAAAPSRISRRRWRRRRKRRPRSWRRASTSPESAEKWEEKNGITAFPAATSVVLLYYSPARLLCIRPWSAPVSQPGWPGNWWRTSECRQTSARYPDDLLWIRNRCRRWALRRPWEWSRSARNCIPCRRRPRGRSPARTGRCCWRFSAWACGWTFRWRSSSRPRGRSTWRISTWPGKGGRKRCRSETRNNCNPRAPPSPSPSPSLYRFDVEVQDLLHECRQLGHQRLVSVILAHVRYEDGPERQRRDDREPRHRWGLAKRRGNVNRLEKFWFVIVTLSNEDSQRRRRCPTRRSGCTSSRPRLCEGGSPGPRRSWVETPRTIRCQRRRTRKRWRASRRRIRAGTGRRSKASK